MCSCLQSPPLASHFAPPSPLQLLERVLQSMAEMRPVDMAGFSLEGAASSGSASASAAAAEELQQIAEATRFLLTDSLAKGVSQPKFEAALRKLGVADPVALALSAAAFKQKDRLVQSHVERLAELSKGRTLLDFDWEVKHVLSSDRLKAVGSNLVTVSLKLKSNGAAVVASPAEEDKGEGLAEQDVTTAVFELDLPELQAFIKQLETMKSAAGLQ